nr:hypothetical protein GCM10020185_66890 [Pseudomonas brassicacearum subsp. brassicacearum]
MRAASGMRFYGANYRLKENRHITADSEQERVTVEQEAEEARKGFETRLATYEKNCSPMQKTVNCSKPPAMTGPLTSP